MVQWPTLAERQPTDHKEYGELGFCLVRKLQVRPRPFLTPLLRQRAQARRLRRDLLWPAPGGRDSGRRRGNLAAAFRGFVALVGVVQEGSLPSTDRTAHFPKLGTLLPPPCSRFLKGRARTEPPSQHRPLPSPRPPLPPPGQPAAVAVAG